MLISYAALLGSWVALARQVRSSFCFSHMAVCYKGSGEKMLQESSFCPEKGILMLPFLAMSLTFAINGMLECLICITNK